MPTVMERLKTAFSGKPIKPFIDPNPDEPENLTGMALIQQFTTEDEPKVLDFPRGKYKVYWEIFVNEIPGGYTSEVRFYTYETGAVLEKYAFTEPKVHMMKPKVNECIRTVMNKYRRK
jgi:hypothetical protein